MSHTGFVLLEKVQATLGGKRTFRLEVGQVHAMLEGPFLMALSSMATRQPGMEMKVQSYCMACSSRAGAEAIANVAKWVEVDTSSGSGIYIGGEIGVKGWEAIRRAVEHLVS